MTEVPSPCTRLCRLDRSRSRCVACHRTLEEIRVWPRATREERLAILRSVRCRTHGGSVTFSPRPVPASR
ncbi:MAG: DUF1289 domain-containing protein [Gemmatimonadota bacterium]